MSATPDVRAQAARDLLPTWEELLAATPQQPLQRMQIQVLVAIAGHLDRVAIALEDTDRRRTTAAINADLLRDALK